MPSTADHLSLSPITVLLEMSGGHIRHKRSPTSLGIRLDVPVDIDQLGL